MHFAWNPLDTHFFSVYTNHNNEKRRPARGGFGDNDEQEKFLLKPAKRSVFDQSSGQGREVPAPVIALLTNKKTKGER